jgi:catechol 2,3-dioxygenase-like lactoylglutathione lyase family enzyme
MFDGLRTVIYPVADLAASKAWFTDVLGFGPYFDEPFFVGFNVGGYELALLPKGDSGTDDGALVYWGVPNAETAYADLIAKGATEHVPVAEVGEGIKTGTVRAPDGNVVGVIYNPHFQLPGSTQT